MAKKQQTKKATQKPKTPPKPKQENGGRKMFDGKPEADVLTLLEEAFKIGATDEMACLHAGISKSALGRYEAKTEGFREHKQLLKEKPKLFAVQELVKAIEGNGELALKYLERKEKGEYGLRTTMEHEGVIGTYNLNDEDRAELLEILRKSKEQK